MLKIMDKVELKDETSILPSTCYVQCCDNLELLKSQPNESVDMIYCDILYGTGRNFGDYQDLKPIRSEIESHYLPRLIEMKRVLKQNGSIYLQMDTRINHWIRCLMDDVFGYRNFRNEIIWVTKNGGSVPKNDFGRKHDVILRYCCSDECTYNPIMRKIKGNGWRSNGERYNPDVDLTPISDVWEDISPLHAKSKEKIYETQKPKELIKRIVLASTNEGDVVADYYLGSGTTAVVCKELNRNFVGCDLNQKAIEITKARLNGGQ